MMKRTHLEPSGTFQPGENLINADTKICARKIGNGWRSEKCPSGNQPLGSSDKSYSTKNV